MAQFAPVVPLQLAQALQSGNPNKDNLGGYHLLLAHDILDKPRQYQEIYGRARKTFDGSFFILDNSIIELGKAMEIKEMLAAAAILPPDCIVIPDVMGDGAGTRKNAVKFARQYAQAAYAQGTSDVPSLMGVLQGSNVQDIMETLGVFYALPFVEYIGIPRVITKMLGSRMPTLLAMQRSPAISTPAYSGFKGYHLLGFSDDIMDDIACCHVPWINGIDSAVLARAAVKGLLLDLNNPEWSNSVGPRGDFWNWVASDAQLKVIVHNLGEYRRLILN